MKKEENKDDLSLDLDMKLSNESPKSRTIKEKIDNIH